MKLSEDYVKQLNRSIKTYAAIIEKITKNDITEFTTKEQLHIMTACNQEIHNLGHMLEMNDNEDIHE